MSFHVSLKPTRRPRRSLGFRPQVETLEDRCVLSTLLALDGARPQHLVVFDSATPGTISSQIPISGLVSGDVVESIAFRPSTSALYALGSGSDSARLYTVDPSTGAATLVSPAAGFPTAFGTSNEKFTIAFDPVTDQLRLVGTSLIRTASENLRINPATGTVTATDAPLTFPNTDAPPFPTPVIVGIAYDRAAPGATATTLFGVEAGSLFRFPSPALVTIGSINGTPNSANSGIVASVSSLFGDTDFEGFAIAPGTTTGTDVGYAVYTGRPIPRFSPNGIPTTLTAIDLTTGAESPIGFLGGGISIIALAVVPSGVTLPTGGGSGGGSVPSSPSQPANLTGNQRFVSEAFQVLLGRNPDANSLSTFAAFLDQGFSRLQFVIALQHTPEYYVHTVNDLYQSILGRAADPGSLQAGALFLAAGGSQDELKALLYGSPEYFRQVGGTNDGFVSALFMDVTGQPADAATRGLLDSLLAAGVSRTALSLILLKTPDANLEQVRRFFTDFLGRLPGTAEANLHAVLIQATGSADLDLAMILASDELFNQT